MHEEIVSEGVDEKKCDYYRRGKDTVILLCGGVWADCVDVKGKLKVQFVRGRRWKLRGWGGSWFVSLWNRVGGVLGKTMIFQKDGY